MGSRELPWNDDPDEYFRNLNPEEPVLPWWLDDMLAKLESLDAVSVDKVEIVPGPENTNTYTITVRGESK